MTVHIIDWKTGIAVFEEANGSSKNYYLMIATEKIKSVPLIINNCENRKQTELKFEVPDYSGWIKGKK